MLVMSMSKYALSLQAKGTSFSEMPCFIYGNKILRSNWSSNPSLPRDLSWILFAFSLQAKGTYNKCNNSLNENVRVGFALDQ